MSITLKDYVGPHATSRDWTQERQRNSAALLVAANRLMAEAALAGVEFSINPKTNSQISGSTYGGFRPQNCPIGAPNSNHKEGRGVDVYDPKNEIDAWCMKNLDVLEQCGIWIEHPSKTNTWSHWQSVAPRSGNRVYMP
jgi:hypothetical protein